MNFLQIFPQFMNRFRGQDPNLILQKMLSSGQINQQQLNQVQQMKSQMEEKLNGFKSMFGF